MRASSASRKLPVPAICSVTSDCTWVIASTSSSGRLLRSSRSAENSRASERAGVQRVEQRRRVVERLGREPVEAGEPVRRPTPESREPFRGLPSARLSHSVSRRCASRAPSSRSKSLQLGAGAVVRDRGAGGTATRPCGGGGRSSDGKFVAITRSASIGTIRHASAASKTRSLSHAAGRRTSSARCPAARSAADEVLQCSSAPPRMNGTWAPHTQMSIDRSDHSTGGYPARHCGAHRSTRLRAAPLRRRRGRRGRGGAARDGRGLADRGWDVEILTTCARDHFTWANEFPPGVESRSTRSRSGASRPCVDTPRAERARAARRASCSGDRSPITEQQRWMNDDLRVPELFHYLLDHSRPLPRPRVRALPVLDDVRLRSGRAGTHDPHAVPARRARGSARHLYAPLFSGARGVWFLSEPERDLARRSTKPVAPHAVIGAGVTVPESYDPDGFRERHGIDGPVRALRRPPRGRARAGSGCSTRSRRPSCAYGLPFASRHDGHRRGRPPRA